MATADNIIDCVYHSSLAHNIDGTAVTENCVSQWPYPWDTSKTIILGGGYSRNTTVVADKPHEAIDKATRQIASAARDLLESADKLGVPIDKDALREAIIKRITEALAYSK